MVYVIERAAASKLEPGYLDDGPVRSLTAALEEVWTSRREADAVRARAAAARAGRAQGPAREAARARPAAAKQGRRAISPGGRRRRIRCSTTGRTPASRRRRQRCARWWPTIRSNAVLEGAVRYLLATGNRARTGSARSRRRWWSTASRPTCRRAARAGSPIDGGRAGQRHAAQERELRPAIADRA